MSIRVMTDVWSYSGHKGSELLLLLAIADHAHDDGGGAYPSIDSLAKKTRLSRRQTQYNIKSLTASGELKVDENAGPNGVHMYTVTRQWHTPTSKNDDENGGVQDLHSETDSTVQDETRRGAKSDTKGCNTASETVQPIAHKPSENHQLNRQGTNTANAAFQPEIIDVPFTDTTGYEPLRPQFQNVLDIEPAKKAPKPRYRGNVLAAGFYRAKGLTQKQVGKAWNATVTTMMKLPEQYTEADVEACTRYMLTLFKYREPTTLEPWHVVKGLPEWAASGRPEVSVDYARANGQQVGQPVKTDGNYWRSKSQQIRSMQQSQNGD